MLEQLLLGTSGNVWTPTHTLTVGFTEGFDGYVTYNAGANQNAGNISPIYIQGLATSEIHAFGLTWGDDLWTYVEIENFFGNTVEWTGTLEISFPSGNSVTVTAGDSTPLTGAVLTEARSLFGMGGSENNSNFDVSITVV